VIARAILAVVLLAGVAFTAQAGCRQDKATGNKVCVYSGTETGWGSTLSFGTVNGEPRLLVTSDADAGKINATEVMFRIEGGETFRLPVHAGNSASNCFWGVMLVGACMPTSSVSVKLDRATMERLAAADRTYVTPVDGNSMGKPVKLKGSQMRTWLSRMPAPPTLAAQ